MSFAPYLQLLDRVLSHFRQAQLQLQQAYDFGALLQCITDRVRDSFDEAQILQTVVQELAVGLSVISCDAGIYDLPQQTSTVTYEYVVEQAQSIKGMVIAMTDYADLYGQLLRGQSVQFCWCSLNPTQGNVRHIQDRFTALAHPIADNEQVIGDLWLYRSGDTYFDDEELWLVRQVATQCAIAIRQARLYQAAQLQVTELAHLNRLKDDFLANMSHELRTPVSNIVMAVQMLELELQQAGMTDDVESPTARYLRLLKQESQHEITLINNLLALSHIEAETEPLVLTTIDPHAWITHVAEPFITHAQEHEVHLCFDIPADLPPLTTDLLDLERILTELLTNACKYTPIDGTITISVCLSQQTPTCLDLAIRNTGIDLSEEECNQIFDKFYRILNDDPWKDGGAGLGLAVVKKLSARLGATIHAHSAAGEIVFMLQLPLSAVALS